MILAKTFFYLQQVCDLCTLLHVKLRHMKSFGCVPTYGQLLVGEVQQIIQCFIVYLAVGSPAQVEKFFNLAADLCDQQSRHK